MTDAIEAGARAMQRGVCLHCRLPATGEGGGIVSCDCPNRAWDTPTDSERAQMVIEAAIASGALVPASAVAEMRERCAEAAQNAFAETIANYALIGPGGMARQMVNAIRQLDISPACGDYVVVLDWSETSEPNEYSSYHHCYADTPFGRYQIEWKGWKDRPAYTAETRPGGQFIPCDDDTLEGAKKAVCNHITEGIRSMLNAATRTGGGK